MIDNLKNILDKIHEQAYVLCINTFGKPLKNAGNIGVFCQSEAQYIAFTELRTKMTKQSNDINQKYFELNEPIVYEAVGEIPKATYTHLYIRRYDPEELHIGDVDFYLEDSEFHALKKRVSLGEDVIGARLYDRKDLDMVELYDKSMETLAYVSTKEMTERARVKQSEETVL